MHRFRRKYKRSIQGILFLFLLMGISCKDHDLEDFKLETSQLSQVSASNEAGKISKSNEKVIVPLTVNLSQPATKAFQVGIELDRESIIKQIEDGQLMETVALEAEYIELPNVVVIPFGASKVHFEVGLSITGIEKHYGKKLAFSYRLIEPSKGNSVGDASNALVTLNTLDLLEENEIHYLSIANGGGGILEVQNRKNYTSSSGGLTIPLGIHLAGSPGGSFSVSSQVTTDTIATLVSKGILPSNTVTLLANQFTLDTLNQVGSNQSMGKMDLIIPWDVIEQNLENIIAYSIKLTKATRHVIDPAKSEVIVVIYPRRVVEVDITNEGIYSVSRDNNDGPDSGEGSLKLVDNNYNSKFLVGDYVGDLSAQFQYEEAQNLGAYTITSGNDAPERDAKDWVLEGSNDGQNWVLLDQRSDENFENRLQTRRFEINNPAPYKFFRISFTNNHGSNLLQITELRLIRTP